MANMLACGISVRGASQCLKRFLDVQEAKEGRAQERCDDEDLQVIET